MAEESNKIVMWRMVGPTDDDDPASVFGVVTDDGELMQKVLDARLGGWIVHDNGWMEIDIKVWEEISKSK